MGLNAQLVVVSAAVVIGAAFALWHQRRLIARRTAQMDELFNSTLSTLALAIDAKDKHRQGHSLRVQKYARALAEAMRLTHDQIEAIAAAALLHDIGKLAVPEYILNKQGSFTPEEQRQMCMHPQLGAEIISNIKFPYPVADSILAHHERLDGTGYPKGLSGESIPLGARVLAIVDAFDGYISDRVESRYTLEAAMQFIRNSAGTAFDASIVSVWETIYRDLVVWPSTPASTAYTGIQKATSELKILESLAQSVEGLTSVQEIFFIVLARITKFVPGSSVVIQRGEREGIPVVFGDKTIATISVHRSEPALGDDDHRLIHAVADKIAPALNNAMTIETARRDATVDKLTGLANRRAFELMTASLQRQHYSIVLIDLNSFKWINDNFGHAAGDGTLIRVAAHLRAAFHDAHLICRLGGDEFLVLSFADIRGLRSQIRHFRRMVAHDPAHDGYQGVLFGASCGVASIPGDADDIDHAVRCADKRMYSVKARFKQFARRASDAAARTHKRPELVLLSRNTQSPSVAEM